MIDRKIIPVTGKPRDIKFPEFSEIKLDNGLKIFFIKDSRYDLITLRLLFRSGSFCDSLDGDDKSGLASLTSEMLNKGTSQYDAHEIAELLDISGALSASGAGYDASYISATFLSSNFDIVFSLVSDFILNPSFPEKELSIKKNRIINSLTAMQDDGAYLAERIFRANLYSGSPYSGDPDGNIKSVSRIDRNDVKKFWEKYFNPSNMIAAVIGNFNEDYIYSQISKKFGFSKNAVRIDFPDINLKKPGIKVYLKEKKDATQASLHIGHRGVPRNNPDSVKIIFLNTMLGGSFTSRLNINLREKKGLTYGVRSSFTFLKYSGDFSVEAEVNHDKSGEAVDEIIRELYYIKNNYAQEDEIQKTKNYISGNYPLQLESSNNVAGKILSLELYGISKNYYDYYLSEINSINAADVMETAQKYIFPEELTIVAAGNVSKLKEQLSKFGEIIITEEVL